MALMLDVPWRDEPLPVGYEGVTDQIVASGSPHVCPVENDVRVVNFFEERNRVPDVRRYRIEQEDCCPPPDGRYCIRHDRYLMPDCDFSECTRQQELQENGSIVLLLESPHKDEYKNGDIARPKKPACGSTGDNIDRCLGTVLSEISIEADHIVPGRHVIISNPIQFQTSLYAIHEQRLAGTWKTLRNNVWWTLWNESEGQIKQCFQERLVDTYNPSLIINACTGKKTTNGVLTRTLPLTRTHGLRSLVTEFVRAVLPVVPLYEAYHPAINWNNSGNFGLHPIPPVNQNAGDPQQ